MACTLSHKTSKDNTTQLLINMKAVEPVNPENIFNTPLKIINQGNFDLVVKKIREQTTKAYGVMDSLYRSVNGYAKINTEVGERIDNKRKELGLYEKVVTESLHPLLKNFITKGILNADLSIKDKDLFDKTKKDLDDLYFLNYNVTDSIFKVVGNTVEVNQEVISNMRLIDLSFKDINQKNINQITEIFNNEQSISLSNYFNRVKELYPEHTSIINLLLSSGVDLNIPIEVFTFKDATNAAFVPGVNKILYSPNKFEKTDRNIVDVINHEIIHSITYKRLRTDPNLVRELNELYLWAESYARAKWPSLPQSAERSEFINDLYGLRNLDEFLSEAFTNPAFIRFLNEVPYNSGKTNLYDAFVNWILSVLNIQPNGNLYNEVVRVFKDSVESRDLASNELTDVDSREVLNLETSISNQKLEGLTDIQKIRAIEKHLKDKFGDLFNDVEIVEIIESLPNLLFSQVNVLTKLDIKDIFAHRYLQNNSLPVKQSDVKTKEDLYKSAKGIVNYDYKNLLIDKLTLAQKSTLIQEAEAGALNNPQLTNLVLQARNNFNNDTYWKPVVKNFNDSRQQRLDEWKEYLSKENQTYANNPFIQEYIWNVITKGANLNPSTLKSISPPLNRGVLAEMIYYYDSNNLQLPNYKSFLQEYVNKVAGLSLSNSNKLEVRDKDVNGVWVYIPSEKEDPENFQSNVAKLQSLSYDGRSGGQDWCTRTYNAEPYLKEGGFFLYIEQPKDKEFQPFHTKVAIRLEGNSIKEIQGHSNNGDYPKEYKTQIKSLIDSDVVLHSKQPAVNTLDIEYYQSVTETSLEFFQRSANLPAGEQKAFADYVLENFTSETDLDQLKNFYNNYFQYQVQWTVEDGFEMMAPYDDEYILSIPKSFDFVANRYPYNFYPKIKDINILSFDKFLENRSTQTGEDFTELYNKILLKHPFIFKEEMFVNLLAKDKKIIDELFLDSYKDIKSFYVQQIVANLYFYKYVSINDNLYVPNDVENIPYKDVFRINEILKNSKDLLVLIKDFSDENFELFNLTVNVKNNNGDTYVYIEDSNFVKHTIDTDIYEKNYKLFRNYFYDVITNNVSSKKVEETEMRKALDDFYNLDQNENFSKRNNLIEGSYNSLTGQVQISSRSINSLRRAEQVFLHEIVGHRGVENIFSNKGIKEYNNIIFSYESVLIKNSKKILKNSGYKSIEQLSIDYQLDLNTEKGKIGLLKELLARYAETDSHSKASWFVELVSKLKEFFSNYFKIEMTESDVKGLISRARKNSVKTRNSSGNISNIKIENTKQKNLHPPIKVEKAEQESTKERLLSFLQKINPNFTISIVSDLSEPARLDLENFIISLQNGNDITSLSEETAHVFIETLDPNSKLFKNLSESIILTEVYRRTVRDYKGLSAYQNTNGTPNYEKLLREAMAKAVTIELMNPDLMDSLVKSESLRAQIKKIIKDMINWFKRETKKNPYKVAAIQILSNKTTNLSTKYIKQRGYFYNIGNTKFETLDGLDISQKDVVFFNLNDTLLDYVNYEVDKETKLKMFNDNDTTELDKYYSLGTLTPLGKELSIKQSAQGNRLVVITTGKVTDALRLRLLTEFGINEVIQIPKDEDGNTMYASTVINGYIKTYPNSKPLLVDDRLNKRGSLLNEYFHPYDKTLLFKNAETDEDFKRLQNAQKSDLQTMLNELGLLDKQNLPQIVERLLITTSNNLRQIVDREDVGELSKVFQNASGEVLLPKEALRKAKELLENTETVKEGLLNFLTSLSGIDAFFANANKNGYKELEDLTKGDDAEVDRGLKEAAFLMRMIHTWKSHIDEVKGILNVNDTGITPLFRNLINKISLELDNSDKKIKQIAVNTFQTKLSAFWIPVNENVNEHFDELIKSRKDKGEFAEEQIKSIEKERQERLVTPEKILNILTGNAEDVGLLNSHLEDALFSKDPIIASIAKWIELITSEASEEHTRILSTNAVKLLELEERLKELGIDKDEIKNRLTFIEDFPDYTEEEIKSRPTLTLISRYKGYELALAKEKEKVFNAQKVYLENKTPENRRVYYIAKSVFEDYLTANFHREYSQDYYTRYDSITTDKDLFIELQEIQQEIRENIRRLQNQLISIDANESEINSLIEDEIKKLRNLRSNNHLDGSKKTGRDLDLVVIAQKKQEIDNLYHNTNYNYKLFGSLLKEHLNTIDQTKLSIKDKTLIYQIEDILDNPETNDLKQVTSLIKLLGIEFLDTWMTENTRTLLTEEFYTERERILDEIESLSDSVNKEVIKKMRKSLFDNTSFLRDKNSELVGSDITIDSQRALKEFEEKIEELQRKASDDLNPIVKASLAELFKELNELQSKELTDDYISELSDFLDQAKTSTTLAVNALTIFKRNLNWDYITDREFSDDIDILLEQPENAAFKEWFESNHKVTEYFDVEIQEKIRKYSPAYIWRKTVSNPTYYTTQPSFKFSKREVLDTYVKAKRPGITVSVFNDNKFLPLNSLFDNPMFTALENSTKEEDRLLMEYRDLLEKLKVDAQKDAPRSSKLENKIAYVNKNQVEDRNQVRRLWRWLTNKLQPVEEEEVNKSKSEKFAVKTWFFNFIGVNNEVREPNQINTDIEGREVKKIYTPYTTWVDPKDITKDIATATLMEVGAVTKTKYIIKTIPTLRLLEKILESAGTIQNKMSKSKSVNKVLGTTNNRLTQLRHIMDTELFGQFKKLELGSTFDLTITFLQKINTLKSQSLINPLTNIKNYTSGTVQNYISAGKIYTQKSFKQAFPISYSSVVKVISNIGKKEKNVESLLMNFFFSGDFLELTNRYTGNKRNEVLKDAVFIGQNFGEKVIRNQIMYAHLMSQTVFLSKVDELVSNPVSLLDIIEIKDNKLSFKEAYKKNGERYSINDLRSSKVKVTAFRQDTQGYFENKTILQTYTIGNMFLYFKRFLFPALRNRFSSNRTNIAYENVSEGYYRTFFKLLLGEMYSWLKYKQSTYSTLSEQERIQAKMVMKDMMVMYLMLMILKFVFDYDDEEGTLEEKDFADWLQNSAILVTLMTQMETRTLNPFPPFLYGETKIIPAVGTETYKFITEPVLGLRELQNLMKTIDHSYQHIADNESAYYDKGNKNNNIEKGDSKLGHDLSKMFGVMNGWYTLNPNYKINVLENIGN